MFQWSQNSSLYGHHFKIFESALRFYELQIEDSTRQTNFVEKYFIHFNCVWDNGGVRNPSLSLLKPPNLRNTLVHFPQDYFYDPILTIIFLFFYLGAYTHQLRNVWS